MAKFNLQTNQESTVTPREELVLGLSDQLDLNLADSNIESLVDDSGVSKKDTAFQEMPAATPEEALALEERQRGLEVESAFQDRFGTGSVDMGPRDIHNIFGPDNAPRVIEGIKRLGQTDSVMLPLRDDAEKLTVMKSMMGVPREPKVLAEGEVDTQHYVDKNKTTPLSPAELFGHMGAVRLTNDSRTFEVLPDFQVLSMSLVEAHLSKNLEQDAVISQEVIETLGASAVSDLTGISESELKEQIAESSLGKMIAVEWVKMQQRANEGPDAEITDHLDPDKELTKEAHEQLGLWAKQAYALAMPEMVQPVQVKTANGRKRNDFMLTPHGAKTLEDHKANLMPPPIVARPQITATPETSPKYQKAKTTTGVHYESKKDKGRLTKEQEAASNLSKVRHVVTQTRLKAGMLFSILGLSASAQVDIVDGKLVIPKDTASIIGLGEKAVNKINDASRNATLMADNFQSELNAARQDDPRILDLEDKIEVLRAFALEAAMPEWKQRMYRTQQNKALGMLQDIAEFKNDPLSFSMYIQNGTSRIGYLQQKMNPQSHKLARQLYGSGTKYIIKPGSGSPAEWAMLVTFGSHFFTDGNSTPQQIVKNMKDRIQMKDQKVMAIASVGRKIKGILENYDVDATTDAILKMEANHVEGRVKGVKDVMSTVGGLTADEEVKKFLVEVMKKHPDEAINLIEEAVELGNYMDSLESGKHFTSTMRPVEVDGITNGVASLTTQLGLEKVMYRIGVLREDPAKVLAEYNDLEGNIRAELAENMRKTLPNLLADKDFRKEFNVSDADLDQIRDVLELAIANDTAFLKPPIMTLPYGQAIKSMGQTMLNAITTSPELSDLAGRTNFGRDGGVLGASKLLHRILEHNLNLTLGKEVSDFSAAVKDVTLLSEIVDEPLIFKKPTDTWTSVNSVSFTEKEGKVVSSRIREKLQEPAGKDGDIDYGDPTKKNPSTIGNVKAMRTEFTPTELSIGGLGTKAGGGSVVKQGILPQMIISYDGAAMAKTLSGRPYSYIQGQTGQKTPYVVAIYDAVIGDLGSFKPLVETINKVWVDTTVNYDIINSIADGAESAYQRGLKKLQEKASLNPDGFAENKTHVAYVLDFYAKNKLNYGFARVMAGRHPPGVDAMANRITNQQLLHLVEGLYQAQVSSGNLEQRLNTLKYIARQAKDRREKLRSKIGANPVFQYHVDALKHFNFP
jgi:hypothetical protein